MKRIELQSLELTQFQCFDYYKAEFSPGVTNISGDNGVGKTTLYSALTWLLFGKDAYDRKEFDTRHKVNGEVDYNNDTIVIGRFKVIENGMARTVKLQRGLRGTQNSIGTWNDNTICYINDVPKLVGEYQDAVNEIIEEETFKMLTSVNYFLSLDTKTQREILCSMAGVREVDEIIFSNDRLCDIYAGKPQNMSLSDYIKSCKDALKQYKDDKKGIQPSINALTQSKPVEQNWLDLEFRKKELQDEVAQYSEQLASMEEAVGSKMSERTKIYVSLQEQKNRLSQLQKECAAEKDNIAKIAEDDYKEKLRDYKELEIKIKTARREYDAAVTGLEVLRATHERLDTELNELFARYNDENNKTFVLGCPLMDGYECKEIQGKAREEREKAFEDAKQKRIDAIMAEGKAKNKHLTEVYNQVENAATNLETYKSTYENLSRQFSNVSEPKKMEYDFKDIDARYAKEYEKVEVDIKSLEHSYMNFKVDTNNTEIKAKQIVAQRKLEEVIRQLADKEQIARIDQQIEDTKAHGKEIADAIAVFEEVIDGLQTIERMVIDDAAKRINSMFQITHWETTVRLKNGTLRDICKPTVDGISASLNTATRINIGLDIISAISRYKQVQAPIFVDNRESINELVNLESQVINLRVAPKGTPLTIHKS